MTRLLSATPSERLAMDRNELHRAIKANEGRTVVAECFAPREPIVEGVTSAEIARAFGADLLLLNGLDLRNPEIRGIDAAPENAVRRLRELVGAPVGVNLEPVDPGVPMLEERQDLPPGRRATGETAARAAELGVDVICLTGNPGTGVSSAAIVRSIREVSEHFKGMIWAGKMHAAGVAGPVVDEESVRAMIDAGADAILVPAIGTVPGIDHAQLARIVRIAHERDVLVMTTIGTSQEGASRATIRDIALRNKIAGADIQHCGDAGYSGMSVPENIFELSVTIRGMRHTIAQMARSVLR